MARNYWLDLFSGATWDEFLAAGSKVSGFRASRWNTIQKISKGDYFLCYLTGVSRFVGLLEVISEPFRCTERNIWQDEDFPCRIEVKPIVALTPVTAVPIIEMKDHLSIFQNLKNPNAWTGHVRSSPAKWKRSDGKTIENFLLEAQDRPVERPVDERKLKYRPKALRAKIGSVTVPDLNGNGAQPESKPKEPLRPTEHTHMQWLLLNLGADMGFDVWVARNDKSRECNGKLLSDLPRIKSDLPLQFDEATNKTIELIDVLWLQGNAIVAAFEIESTTSIYSGLLRMADLIAMQPNLNIPLYLVAPDERREKVMSEVNRPTFSRLTPPLSQICRFVSFAGLKEHIEQIASYIRFMKPEFLDEVSESCELEEA